MATTTWTPEPSGNAGAWTTESTSTSKYGRLKYGRGKYSKADTPFIWTPQPQFAWAPET